MAPVTTTLFCVVFLAAFELGSCALCYICTSAESPDCKDPFIRNASLQVQPCGLMGSYNFNNQHLRPVYKGIIDGYAGSDRYCHKLVLKSGTVVRACLDTSASEPNRTCELLKSNNVKLGSADLGWTVEHCSVCEGVGCNAAGSIAASLTLAGFAAVVALTLLGHKE